MQGIQYQCSCASLVLWQRPCAHILRVWATGGLPLHAKMWSQRWWRAEGLARTDGDLSVYSSNCVSHEVVHHPPPSTIEPIASGAQIIDEVVQQEDHSSAENKKLANLLSRNICVTFQQMTAMVDANIFGRKSEDTLRYLSHCFKIIQDCLQDVGKATVDLGKERFSTSMDVSQVRTAASSSKPRANLIAIATGKYV